MTRPSPLIAAAMICERVIEEKEGVLSAIRIVDTITIPKIPWPVTLSVLVSLKSGAARGKHTLKLVLRTPSGKEPKEVPQFPLFFEGEERGTNVVVNFVLQASEEGLYWFDVLIDEKKNYWYSA